MGSVETTYTRPLGFSEFDVVGLYFVVFFFFLIFGLWVLGTEDALVIVELYTLRKD